MGINVNANLALGFVLSEVILINYNDKYDTVADYIEELLEDSEQISYSKIGSWDNSADYIIYAESSLVESPDWSYTRVNALLKPRTQVLEELVEIFGHFKEETEVSYDKISTIAYYLWPIYG